MEPERLLQVAAAFSFSLCATVMVASKSRHNPASRSGPAPAAHAAARARALAARISGRLSSVTRSSTRHVVGIDATGPNRSCRFPSTLMPLIASAPSATATARSVNTRPGACTGTPW